MLKWIAPKGNQPRSASNRPTAHSYKNTSPRITDDPLATIDVSEIALDNKRIPSKSKTSKRRPEPEQIYSVTRINPLFVESRDMLPANSNNAEGEKRLMNESHSSNRSEQCQTPSSSGYESAAGLEKRPGNISNNNANQQPIQPTVHRHHGHHQQHLVELSPASDYRRQFVLGARLDRSTDTANVPRRIGKANLLRQNATYVTGIHIPSVKRTSSDEEQKPNRDEWDDDGSPSDRIIPHPIWPSSGNEKYKSVAVVKQNENYVTKIMIAPRTVESVVPVGQEQQATNTDDQDGYDSIVTHSLLMMTSYDGFNSSDGGQSEEKNDQETRTPAELAEIRQLSQTLSQSRVVASVARALSKSSGSSSSSASETYSSYPTAPASATAVDLEGQHISATIGGSIARRISLMKERWDKSSRRHLLVESDEDDPATLYRRLDHLYVPQNGDANYSAAGQLLFRETNSSERSSSKEYAGSSPFSYLAGLHQTAIMEEPVANRSVYNSDPFEQDRQSNSSSRSSGSRRVTFSADTVDNEQSARGSFSSGSSSGSVASGGERNKTSHHHHQPAIVQELKLNPQYLPHRYQQPQSTSSSDRSRLAGYYSHNLQAHNELSYNDTANKGAEKVSMWEHYHETGKPLPTISSSSTSAGASIIRMEPYGNLQLHPNYGAACQDRALCVDFTLDGGEVSLLQRRSDSEKLRRRLCCCVLLLLCLAVLVVVVIGISLYLSHGQKIFGSVGAL